MIDRCAAHQTEVVVLLVVILFIQASEDFTFSILRGKLLGYIRYVFLLYKDVNLIDYYLLTYSILFLVSQAQEDKKNNLNI